MNETHAYCDNCETIREVFFEGLKNVSTDGSFLGGDVVCKDCAWIVATLYVRVDVVVSVEATARIRATLARAQSDEDNPQGMSGSQEG